MFNFHNGRYDPVQEEIENHQPFFQHQGTQVFTAFVLRLIIWVVARLLGIKMPFRFHFPV
jgi:hypothetical protein